MLSKTAVKTEYSSSTAPIFVSVETGDLSATPECLGNFQAS